jgi:hypothetical protein
MQIEYQGKIHRDWDGATLPLPVSFEVKVTDHDLVFGVTTKLDWGVPFLGKSGGFFRGLWDGDVAELFLSTDGAEDYVEFNLAPSGAWWFQRFSAYRQCILTDIPQSARIQTARHEDLWSGSITINTVELGFDSTAPMLFNVCLIVGHNPRRYISASGGLSSAPDFHKRELLRPLLNSNHDK